MIECITTAKCRTFWPFQIYYIQWIWRQSQSQQLYQSPWHIIWWPKKETPYTSLGKSHFCFRISLSLSWIRSWKFHKILKNRVSNYYLMCITCCEPVDKISTHKRIWKFEKDLTPTNHQCKINRIFQNKFLLLNIIWNIFIFYSAQSNAIHVNF